MYFSNTNLSQNLQICVFNSFLDTSIWTSNMLLKVSHLKPNLVFTTPPIQSSQLQLLELQLFQLFSRKPGVILNNSLSNISSTTKIFPETSHILQPSQLLSPAWTCIITHLDCVSSHLLNCGVSHSVMSDSLWPHGL